MVQNRTVIPSYFPLRNVALGREIQISPNLQISESPWIEKNEENKNTDWAVVLSRIVSGPTSFIWVQQTPSDTQNAGLLLGDTLCCKRIDLAKRQQISTNHTQPKKIMYMFIHKPRQRSKFFQHFLPQRPGTGPASSLRLPARPSGTNSV